MNKLICPHCRQEIEISEAFRHQIEEEIGHELTSKHKKELEDVRKKTEQVIRKKIEEDIKTEQEDLKRELDEKNKAREINGLMEVIEKFSLKEGLILTYGQENNLKIKKIKIKILPVWKWLLNQN